jgi:sugar phosphate isomerase/epimerase
MAPPVSSRLAWHVRLFARNMATEFTFLIPLGWEGRDERLAFARRHGLGVEVTAFIGGKALNDSGIRGSMEGQLERELSTFKSMKTLHGAFLDLALHSPDARVAAISQSRIERDILTARRLGCEKIVFHLGFNPLVPVSRYRSELIKAHAEFWAYVLASYPGITICLENQWESDWSIFGELFDTVQHPRLGMCLDVAHAHVHGHFSSKAWIRGMATHVSHMHWNDNWGDCDDHLPLGAGNIDWSSIFDACRAWKTASVTLEMQELGSLQRSLSFLERQGVLPRSERFRSTTASALTPP